MNGFDFSTLTPPEIAGLALGGLVLVVLFGLWRTTASRQRRDEHARLVAEQRSREAEAQLARLAETQAALTGQLQTLQQGVAGSQEAFSRQLDERLAGVTKTVGASLTETTQRTQESLGVLQERLAVIDTAQNNIQGLAANVVGLQQILENKQTRGAFGEARMEAIISDGLPIGAYEFQATLSNGRRPDCSITMPNDSPPLLVDAKFPLEAWNSIRQAESEDMAQRAAKQFTLDMDMHIKAVSEKYLIPGETQDTAFLFVPSESIFAEIHEHYEAIVQKAHRARIVIVSPSLLLLSVQVIQALLKDARMREQAHLIQAEIAKFANDLNRLDERVGKLQSHFGMTQKDVEQILISTGKLKRHGERIEEMDFRAPAEEAKSVPASKPVLRAIDGGESQS
jgi:DNA recombination protein RmuC